LPGGTCRLGGLPPGRSLLEVLPLRPPAGPSTLGGIFTGDSVDTGFRETFFAQTVRVAAGQTVSGVSVEVK